MWRLIAEMVSTYAEEGDLDKAIETLAKALATEPQWAPNALLDDRTLLLRNLPEFRRITTIPEQDAPAHFHAAQVALEYDKPDVAYEFLAETFRLAHAQEMTPLLLEALHAEEAFAPYLSEPRFAALLAKYGP
jgi:hypothetical protein